MADENEVQPEGVGPALPNGGPGTDQLTVHSWHGASLWKSEKDPKILILHHCQIISEMSLCLQQRCFVLFVFIVLWKEGRDL